NAADPGSLVGQPLTLVFTVPATAAGGAPLPPIPGPFGGVTLPNRTVTSLEEKYTIAGIVERDPAGAIGGALGLSGLMIPLSKAKAANRLPYQSLTVKVTASQFTTDVEDAIKKQGYGAFS